MNFIEVKFFVVNLVNSFYIDYHLFEIT